MRLARALAATPLLITGHALGIVADAVFNTGAALAGSNLRQGLDIVPGTDYVYTTTN